MTTDKHLLLANDSAKQLAVKLERAQHADNYRDTPLMPQRLRQLAEQAQALALEVERALVDYENLTS